MEIRIGMHGGIQGRSADSGNILPAIVGSYDLLPTFDVSQALDQTNCSKNTIYSRAIFMSEFGATQIPKPIDEQAFERCNEVLWRCILNDDNVQCFGRRGQRQYGVDLVGRRGGKSNRIVGIQCKLKGEGQSLTEKEVRDEVEKALGFKPPLSEYIIVTTDRDDAKLQSLALELSLVSEKDRDQELSISIYGWDSLQREISRYPEALDAFDPLHTPKRDQIDQAIRDLSASQSADIKPQLEEISRQISTLYAIQVELRHTGIDNEYDQLIDAYKAFLPTNPTGALQLLTELQTKLDNRATDHIRFRIASNIAACQLELGDEEEAANGFIAAWGISPEDPTAISNKAFGFYLKQDWRSIRAFAEPRLLNNPNNAELAAFYVLSLKTEMDIDNPITHVPELVRNTPQVAVARVHWLMERGEHGAWWEAAIAAHHAFPERVELQELYASALLSRAIDPNRLANDEILDDAARVDIDKAVEIYEARWPEVRDRTVYRRGDLYPIPLNLIIAYRLLARNEEANKVASEALERFPNEVTVKEHVAFISAQEGESERALELISGLDINAQTVMMRFNIAILTGDWGRVSSIVDKHLEVFPESERGIARACGTLARTQLVPQERRRSIVEAEQGILQGDSRALTILAQLARLNKWEDLSDALFEAAESALEDGDDGLTSRFRFATEAMDRRRLDVVTDTLFGHVPLDRDSKPLRMLAHAFVYKIPIRQRATQFFEGLAPKLRGLPYFRRLEGVCHFNRGVPRDAVTPFTDAFEQERCLENILYLIRSLIAIGDRESVAVLLQREGVDALPGSPLERMEFSHVLSEYSEYSRALNLGYEALTGGLDSPDIVMKYLGLVFNCTWDRQDHVFDGWVATGVWVHLAETNGKESTGLVGETADRPWGEKIEPTNAFFAKSLGLKTGDVFEHVNSLGVAEKWTVSEIRPRWLQAFHHLAQSFGQRFPDAPGFASITTREDDIEPILKQVRRQSQAASVRASLYFEKGLPVAVAAGDTPSGGIAFAQYLYSAGMQLRVFSGTAEDRKGALALIEDHAGSGAVLDALTAWHAAGLDIFPVLKERLGSLAIPISELGRIEAMTAIFSGGGDGRSMHLGYRDGRFIGYTETAEERAEKLMELKVRIATIEEACEVEPIEFPDHFSDLGELLIGLPPRDAFAPAVMAGKKRLLLCEDLMMRQRASEAFGTKGVWLQAVLMSAEQAGTISKDAHSDAVIYLATHRHGPVSLNRQLLLSAFERDETPDLSDIQTLCIYIGHTGADLPSHIALGTGFINTLWARARPIVVTSVPVDSKTLKATDLVFGALIGDTNNDEWPKRAAALFRNLDEGPGLYLLRWCDAKFLPVDQIRKILQDEMD